MQKAADICPPEITGLNPSTIKELLPIVPTYLLVDQTPSVSRKEVSSVTQFKKNSKPRIVLQRVPL